MLLVILTAALAGLQPGATVRLNPGTHELIEIKGRSFDPPVTIDASGSVVRGLRLVNVTGVTWRGGSIEAPEGRNGKGPPVYGVDMRKSHGVIFEGVTFTNALRGLVAADSRGLTVRNSRFTGLRSDGINIAGTSDVLIEGSSFTDFTPVKPRGSKEDGTWKDGDHPDAIQMWATKDNRVNTDIVIRGNVIDGDTQGINTFGPRGDGYERIIVENNRVRVRYPSAISIKDCSDCRVRFNKVDSVPGSKYKAGARLLRSTGSFCGNTITDVRSSEGNQKC